MKENKHIEIKGARANNLKNISLAIPRDKLVVMTGVSGSGKSSLAFDTLYAEGQRRYVESLSSYARQFLGRMSKPECDYIKGLPPAIAIEQKVASRNPRSTVGTSTEIYEYLRLLYARIGRTFSPFSGQEVKKQSAEDIVNKALEFAEGTKFMVMAPITLQNQHDTDTSPEDTEYATDKRTMAQQLQIYLHEGYTRVMVNGTVRRIEEVINESNDAPSQATTASMFLIIDRMSVSHEGDAVARLTDSVETAMYEGHGACRLTFLPSNICYDFSSSFEADGMTFEEPNENLFSFNSPTGACPTCEGFGSVIGIDERLVIPNSELSVYEGCVQCWHGEKMKIWQEEFCRRAKAVDFPIFTPYYQLTMEQKDLLWHGLPGEKDSNGELFADAVCIDSFFQMVKENQYKIQYRVMMSRYRGKTTCPTCHGTRLRKEATWVQIGGRAITDLVEMPINRLREWFDQLTLTEHEQQISKRLLVEIRSRLAFLSEVGLGYLTLGRRANTLSGGESQRARLTTSLGSPLVGSLYILDEPSIGLHSRDTDRLTSVLRELQQQGNTVIVVEHDEDMMRHADWLIDIGPDAGRNGGEIVYQGILPDTSCEKNTAKELMEAFPKSYTLRYLANADKIPVPTSRRQWNKSILLKGCRMNNLKGITAELPLNAMTAITGVSGSGKSSLIKGILFPALKRRLNEVADLPGDFSSLEGDWMDIKHVEFVDQNPIGKSTRSNPATYLKAYDAIRQLFADQPLSKQMGFSAQHFSFNAEGGRCEECKGAGVITVEMQFMADLTLTCEACHGKRFKKEILDVRYEGKNIDDVLNMTVDEAIDFFSSNKQKTIVNRLKTLQDVGLGYIQLGQNSSTLSGGENQRVKLAYFIGQEKQDPTLFIFDEPTTGLHFHDISRLLSAFAALIERGHTVLVIEHNLDVIKCADWVIDLGPDGGNAGGSIVATGTPESIAQNKASITGKYLKEKLK